METSPDDPFPQLLIAIFAAFSTSSFWISGLALLCLLAISGLVSGSEVAFFSLSTDELDQLKQHGVDIQLHTHRHVFPIDMAVATKEIQDNKATVNPLLDVPMTHFCYPSGVWSTRHWQVLEREQIKTATTCQTGFVDERSPKFAWPRVLDSSRVSQIEFEAEVSGFNELLRRARA